MDENVKNIFKDQFKKLPPELQQAIMANDLRQKLVTLTQKYKMHIDKAAILENEVVLVLLGMEDPEEFVNNARHQLDLSPEDARGLARDVNDQIFHPIRETLESFINTQAAEYAASNPNLAVGGNSMGEKAPPAAPSAPQGMTAPTPPIGMPRREPVSTPTNPTIPASNLPQKSADPLPALPKDIIADKLRPVAPKPPVTTPPMPQPPATPVRKEDQSLSMKSFGIQIESKDSGNVPKMTFNEVPKQESASTSPNTPPPAPNTPPPKPAVDPYREPVN